MTDETPLPDALATPAITQRARERFNREVLRELQTGGGMTLESLTGRALPTAMTAEHISAIREAVERIRLRRREAPKRAAELIDSLLDNPSAGVDLGAGLAPWSIALAERIRHLRFLAVDLPAAVAPMRNAVENANLGERFELAGLDILRERIRPPASFDFAIIANVAHLLCEADLRRLITVALDLLRTGGLLAVIDQVLDDEPDWRQWSALYAVGATLWMPGGTLYTTKEYRLMLEDSGCHWLGAYQLSPAPALSLLVAKR